MPAKALSAKKSVSKPKADRPKRASSPYIIFCTEKRPEVKDQNPNASFGELGKILGQLWGAMDEKAKAPYVKKSNDQKAALAGA